MIKNTLNQKFKKSANGSPVLSKVQLSYIPGYKISEHSRFILVFKRIVQPLLDAFKPKLGAKVKPESTLSIGQAGNVS